MNELFELPEQYDAMLAKGIALTGNDKSFFIRERLNFLEKYVLQNGVPATILDFGCGTGDTSAEMARRWPKARIVASDPAKAALDFARKRHIFPNLTFVSDTDLVSVQFELIYANGVIHHIDPGQRQDTIRHLFQLLNRGGSLAIFENNPANPGTQWAMYANPFDKGVVKVWPHQLKKYFRQAGLSSIYSYYLFFFPQWLSVFRPIEPFFKSLPLGGQYLVLGKKPST